ncbi:MAG: STAS domain-containing protein [Planctomycetales bacterium]
MINEICVVEATAHMTAEEWDWVEPAADLIIAEAQQHDRPIILFDLEFAGFFGSIFLSLLLRCWKEIEQQGGTLAVCAANDHIQEVLRVSHLNKLWKLFDDRTSALEGLSKGN